MKYYRCTRCRLNYRQGDEKYCKICIKELSGNYGDLYDEEVNICPYCEINTLEYGEDICKKCQINKKDKEDRSDLSTNINRNLIDCT
jgi:hypothetical protein